MPRRSPCLYGLFFAFIVATKTTLTEANHETHSALLHCLIATVGCSKEPKIPEASEAQTRALCAAEGLTYVPELNGCVVAGESLRESCKEIGLKYSEELEGCVE